MNVHNQKGMGIVEILVVVGVITVAFAAIFELFQLQVRAERLKREELRAYALVSESMEAVRSIRDDDWANLSSLSLNVSYYPEIFGSSWVLSSTDPGPIDIYTRWIVLRGVERDGNDDIVSSGSVDSDTLKVESYVEWKSYGDTKTKSVEAYLTNWQRD